MKSSEWDKTLISMCTNYSQLKAVTLCRVRCSKAQKRKPENLHSELA